MAVITLVDPVTRIEGHLQIEVRIDRVNGEQQVVDAWATGTLFRGFESVMVGRAPEDAQHITQRICGVCPVPHGMAAVLALDEAAGVVPPPNGWLLRNIVLAANFRQSHLLSLYQLSLPDYIDGPAQPPWQPSWPVDRRLGPATEDTLRQHYFDAIGVVRKVNAMCAIFAGRLPHTPAYAPGGFTATPTREQVAEFLRLPRPTWRRSSVRTTSTHP